MSPFTFEVPVIDVVLCVNLVSSVKFLVSFFVVCFLVIEGPC